MADRPSSTIDNVKDKVSNTISSISKLNIEKKIEYACILVIVLLILIIIFYIRSKVTLLKKNCKALKKIYNSSPSLSPVPSNTNYLLRDFLN